MEFVTRYPKPTPSDIDHMGFRVGGPWLLYNMLKLTGCDVRHNMLE